MNTTANLYGHIILIKNNNKIYFVIVNNETINNLYCDVLHCENIYNKTKNEPFEYKGGLSSDIIQLMINEELNSTKNTFYCFINGDMKKYKNIQISKKKLFIHTKL